MGHRWFGYDDHMTDPRLEDHAVGVELQMTELVEKIERALQRELDVLQDDLVLTSETIADEHWDHADIHLPAAD